MRYRVIVQLRALDDLDEYYRWAARHTPQTAARWLNRFETELESLASNPERCSLAPENARVRREIRQLLFGRRPNVYRAVFTIDGDTVRVLRIRRAARRTLKKDELD
ncbi:MAG: type II toxin-antitoxin system RelE/ParE family toxin [Pirellulales bacterium]